MAAKPFAKVVPFAKTPSPPYYAVIFSSVRTAENAGYVEASAAMAKLALEQPGCLGVESARGADGLGITVSYWRSLDDVRAWKAVSEHVAVQEKGRKLWYADYRVRVARVEREYCLAKL